MSELLAAVTLLFAVLLAVWFFGLLIQSLEERSYKIGYTQGVIDGHRRAESRKQTRPAGK